MDKKPKKLPYAEFKKIYSKVPRVCVDLVISDKEGIVLSKRSIPPDKGKWHLPGGTVLLGEKTEDTIKRVAYDETGLAVDIKKLISIIEMPEDNPHGHVVSLAHLVTPVGGELRDSEEGEVKFFNKIPRNIIKPHKDFLLENKIL